MGGWIEWRGRHSNDGDGIQWRGRHSVEGTLVAYDHFFEFFQCLTPGLLYFEGDEQGTQDAYAGIDIKGAVLQA